MATRTHTKTTHPSGTRAARFVEVVPLKAGRAGQTAASTRTWSDAERKITVNRDQVVTVWPDGDTRRITLADGSWIVLASDDHALASILARD